MSLLSWLQNQCSGNSFEKPNATRLRSSRRRPDRSHRLQFESLEGRVVLAAAVVTTQLDVLDSNDGLLSLREAVIAANANPAADTIVLPAGSYTLTLAGAGEDFAATGDLDITDDLAIVGAGPGTTVIDGGGLDRVFHVFGDKKVTLSAMTILGGVGGGIRAEQSDLTINDCTISGNSEGGIFADGGALTIEHSTISDNSGGIGAYLSTVTVKDSTISNNSGRGISADGGTLTVEYCTISHNSGYGGGGISVRDYTLLIVDHSTISGNSANGYFAEDGGGIYASLATMTVKDSIVSDNSAERWGGGIYCEKSSTLIVDHSTISGNSTQSVYGDNGGGGIFAEAGTVNVRDSTISGNSGFYGGGIYATHGASVAVKASTISDNSAYYGGGIVSFASLSVDRSTISGNSAYYGGGIYGGGSIKASTISDNSASYGGGIYASHTTIEIDHSTLNDPLGGGIFNDGSIIHLKKAGVDGVFYQNEDYV